MTSPVISLVSFIILLFIMLLLFLTGIELLMARFEFWTMAMLTVPLISFAGLPQTKFLFESALKAMLSLAVKTCVIAFLGSLTSTIMLSYVKAFKESSSITGDMPLLVQCLLMALLMYILTKQIPQMVQGLLTGTPNITGASMTSIAKEGIGGAASVAGGAVSAGANVAAGALGGAKAGAAGGFKAAGGGKSGLVGGALGALGGAVAGGGGAAASMAAGGVRSLLANNPISRGLSRGANAVSGSNGANSKRQGNTSNMASGKDNGNNGAGSGGTSNSNSIPAVMKNGMGDSFATGEKAGSGLIKAVNAVTHPVDTAKNAGKAVRATADTAKAKADAVKNAVQNPMQTLTNMANTYTPPSKGDKGQEAGGGAGKTTENKENTSDFVGDKK